MCLDAKGLKVYRPAKKGIVRGYKYLNKSEKGYWVFARSGYGKQIFFPVGKWVKDPAPARQTIKADSYYEGPRSWYPAGFHFAKSLKSIEGMGGSTPLPGEAFVRVEARKIVAEGLQEGEWPTMVAREMRILYDVADGPKRKRKRR